MRTKILATLCAFGMLGLAACAGDTSTAFHDEYRCAQGGQYGSCLRWEKR